MSEPTSDRGTQRSKETHWYPAQCPTCGCELVGIEIYGPTECRALPCGHLIERPTLGDRDPDDR